MGVNASMVAPITAFQMGVNGMIERSLLASKADGSTKLSDLEAITCAAGAGVISAALYSPVDLVVIQQQKVRDTNKSIFHSQKNVSLTHWTWTGLLPAMLIAGKHHPLNH